MVHPDLSCGKGEQGKQGKQVSIHCSLLVESVVLFSDH
jgi:hypothetical protein